MFGAISSPAASIVEPSGERRSPVATETVGSSSTRRSGSSQLGSTTPSKLTNASSRPSHASAPRLQPAQKPMLSSNRSTRILSHERSTPCQLRSRDPESTTTHSTSAVLVFRASDSTAKRRQPAPLWFTRTIESSGRPSLTASSSQSFSDKRPVGSERPVDERRAARERHHLRVRDRRQQPGELAVADAPQPLRLAAVTPEPARVGHAPRPAPELAPQPPLPRSDREHAELEDDKDRRQQEDEAKRVRAEDEDQAVALEQGKLVRVSAELVVVVDVSVRVDDDAKAVDAGTPSQLDVIEVREQLGRAAAELFEEGPPDRHRGAARGGHVLHRIDAVRGLTVAAGPRQPADVHDGAGRIEQLRAVEEPEARHRYADVRTFDHLCQLL